MFRLIIKPQRGFRYRVIICSHTVLEGFVHKWSIECAEIDLEETVAKVLRVSENLRKLPDSQPVTS
jgi:hypothetical protein